MPQALINRTLDNLILGVSQQYDEAVLDGQMRELQNCVPDVTRGVLRRNPVEKISNLPFNITISDYTALIDKGGRSFILCIVSGGNWYIISTEDGSVVSSGQNDYLIVSDGTPLKKAFKILSIRDKTFIVNKTITVGFATQELGELGLKAFYWIKQTTQVTVKQKTDADTGETGSRLEGWKYTLNGHTVQGVYESRPGEIAIDQITGDKIAEALKNELNNDTALSGTYYSSGTFVYQFGGGPFGPPPYKWDWSDSNGALASLGVWETIQNPDELPVTLPTELDGMVVKVINSNKSTDDDYYLKYSYDDKTWVETTDTIITLAKNTMPHVFTFDGTTFSFDTFNWQDREVGDDYSNPTPYFVGNTINDMVFFQNRLGLVCDSTITLSQVKEYGNFFRRSVKTLLDDDVIDLFIATPKNIAISDAIIKQDTVILFSDTQQFILRSSDGALSPTTAVIDRVGAYQYNKNLGVALWNDYLYFSSDADEYTSIYEMSFNKNDSLKLGDSYNISKHIPRYIDGSVNKFSVDLGSGTIFIESSRIPNKLYVLSITVAEGKTVQRAFHSWLFPQDYGVVGTHSVDGKLYILFDKDNTFGVIDLELPDDITNVKYLDFDTEPYVSVMALPTFWYRGEGKLGSKRGRLQIRTLKISAAMNSKFLVKIRTNRYFRIGDTVPTPIDTVPIIYEDEGIWTTDNISYTREYNSKRLITALGDSKKLSIFITNDMYEPEKGFIIEAINYEALFYQRSSRVVL